MVLGMCCWVHWVDFSVAGRQFWKLHGWILFYASGWRYYSLFFLRREILPRNTLCGYSRKGYFCLVIRQSLCCNFFCESRIVLGESHEGAFVDVSAVYAQLLRFVCCLVNEVRISKDYKEAACVD